MLHQHRFLFLIGLIALIAVSIVIIERFLAKSRLDFVVNLVQIAHENVAFSYDFPAKGMSPAEIESAGGLIIPDIPDHPDIRRAINDFPRFLQSNWDFAVRMRDKYQNYDLTGILPARKTEEQTVYDFEATGGKKVHLNFMPEKRLNDLSELFQNEMRSVSISYYKNKQPDRLLFGQWSSESMGFNLKFYSNGVPEEYVFIYQGMLLGPAVRWGRDGAVLEAHFYHRPQMLTIEKGVS
ncbi:MAG: hypothetical protein JXR73_18780 [Candidatus Omnitrophica bacterium]|nr:hypothetical protein [Candidatus Omnitrophota bacterium]